jgi:hypothetical protein
MFEFSSIAVMPRIWFYDPGTSIRVFLEIWEQNRFIFEDLG